jgi:hypothetical protein
LTVSLGGAGGAADGLTAAGAKVEQLDPRAEIADADLEEWQRLALANAIAAQALRGFVESMLKRRGKIAEPVAEGSGGIDD